MSLRSCCVFSGLFAAASLSCASPITFVFDGVASGTVGGVNFSNAPFKFTQSSDTSLITSSSNGFSTNYTTPFASGASINVGGFGAGTITTVTDVANSFDIFNPANSFVAFALTTGGDVAGHDLTFASYKLQSAVGPITTTNPFVSNFSAASTLGNIAFSGINSLTFTATTGPIPEPGSFSLLGAGVLLLVFTRWFSHGR